MPNEPRQRSSRAKSSVILQQIIQAASAAHPDLGQDEILRHFATVKMNDRNWKKMSINQIVYKVGELVKRGNTDDSRHYPLAPA